jgi:hypothetical protein
MSGSTMHHMNEGSHAKNHCAQFGVLLADDTTKHGDVFAIPTKTLWDGLPKQAPAVAASPGMLLFVMDISPFWIRLEALC